tara:strand:+ start:796 stop:1116 length:321 start_codon:yes stop_codon:yes gene_type:complete
MLTKWILAGLAAAALSFAGLAFVQTQRAANLALENAALSRNAAVMAQAAKQDQRARQIAADQAARWAARSREFETAIQALTDGINDAEINADLRDRLNGLLNANEP